MHLKQLNKIRVQISFGILATYLLLDTSIRSGPGTVHQLHVLTPYSTPQQLANAWRNAVWTSVVGCADMRERNHLMCSQWMMTTWRWLWDTWKYVSLVWQCFLTVISVLFTTYTLLTLNFVRERRRQLICTKVETRSYCGNSWGRSIWKPCSGLRYRYLCGRRAVYPHDKLAPTSGNKRKVESGG